MGYMSTRVLVGQLYADTTMRHGDVRVEGSKLFMTRETFQTVVWQECGGVVWDLMRVRGDGTWQIPAQLLRADEATEVRAALALVEPGESDTCALPTCLQDADTQGLCSHHAALVGSAPLG